MNDTLDAIVAAPDPVVDKRLNLLMVFTICSTALIVVIASVTLIRTWTTSNDTDAIERGNRVAACRALLNQRIIGVAQDNLDAANSERGVAAGDLDVADADLTQKQGELLAAAAVGDDSGFTRIAAEINELQIVVDEAQLHLLDTGRQVEQAIDNLEARRTEYETIVEQSSEDPSAFLERCEQ